jgi:hypothetical protein
MLTSLVRLAIYKQTILSWCFMNGVALLGNVSALSPTHGVAGDQARRNSTFVVALAVLAFAIYACTVFTLPQVRNTPACCESSGIAAAISNIKYGAPLGSLYSGVFSYFDDRIQEPLSLALEQAQRPETGLPATPPGALYATTRDGNGVGYALVATAAFRLFGIHAWALQLTMLLLMALSAAAFLWRFHTAAFAGVVTLYFTALTVMLFTSLVWDPQWQFGIAVGGLRYFSLVGVLPLFHILLTLVDPRPLQRETATRDAALLALQTAIFLLTVLVRGSTLPQVAGIALVCMVLAWRRRRKTEQLRALLGRLAVIGLASIAGLSAVAAAVPGEYLTEGRFGPTIWERVTQGLGTNPAWPFAGVDEIFDCKEFMPQGFQPGTGDDNGHCIWFDYVLKHHIPIETAGDKVLGGSYETAMREAFFKIVARYPAEVLKTFVYYKPQRIVTSMSRSMRFNFGGDQSRARHPAGPPVVPYPPLAIGLLFVSLAVALSHFGIGAVSTAELSPVVGVTVLLAAFTLPTYFAVWASPPVSADLLLYCLFGLGLAAGAMLVGARSALLPRGHGIRLPVAEKKR